MEEVKVCINIPENVERAPQSVENMLVTWGGALENKRTFRYKFLRNSLLSLGIQNNFCSVVLRPGCVAGDLENLGIILAKQYKVQNIFLMGKRVYRAVINGGPDSIPDIIRCKAMVGGRALNIFLCPSYLHLLKGRV